MATERRPAAPAPDESNTDRIATPEGDNEFAPDQPLTPSADQALDGLKTPRGSEPDPYKQDKP